MYAHITTPLKMFLHIAESASRRATNNHQPNDSIVPGFDYTQTNTHTEITFFCFTNLRTFLRVVVVVQTLQSLFENEGCEAT